MSGNLLDNLFIFMLAGFIGFEVIKRVSPLLHTPLMSLTNALDAIAVVGRLCWRASINPTWPQFWEPSRWWPPLATSSADF